MKHPGRNQAVMLVAWFSAGQARLLRDDAKTFGQTRSGTGNTHALGQGTGVMRSVTSKSVHN